jgi:hypothetical protein
MSEKMIFSVITSLIVLGAGFVPPLSLLEYNLDKGGIHAKDHAKLMV